ncbi:MAG: Gfo/Idh/MocA family oxidoreductase [Alphaproteobacteria bacterium]|nr:Gfo/Idh/MocA family oxidoreductase [Alphaproteobacteria bacterium]
MTKTPARLLILGTGTMARAHADEFKKIDGVDIVAAVDTDPDRLREFTREHDIRHEFTSLDAALEWNEFDAASNVTPDRIHHPTTMQLLAAGKHVLCEKPLADNYPHAAEMARAARQAGLVNMINLSYRNLASMQEARRIIENGDIGTVRHFEASYLQSWLAQPAWGDWRTDPTWLWRLSMKHGSLGVLGDVGIHILDYATHVTGQAPLGVSCRLKTFDKAPDGRIGEFVLDANDSFTMQLELRGGALGVIHATRFASGHLNDLHLRVWGDQGGLEVSLEHNVEHLRVCGSADLEKPVWRDIAFPPTDSIYQRFSGAVTDGVTAAPDFNRGAELQEILDLAMKSDRENGRFLLPG